MNPYLFVVFSMAVSMLIIPRMVMLAPRLGMIDEPDPRKVHQKSIPRVGGWGIVLGTLIPLILFLEWTSFVGSFMLATLILFVVGAIDDALELGHRSKFVGQLIAVFIMVQFGDVWIHTPPYLPAEWWSPLIGKLFAGFAMLGMINATNHSDGLDGLAGGETLLSLLIVAFLALSVGAGEAYLSITAATIGGILGFLRYNTYPAIVFMGDSGSTFLGFTIAVLVILLSQEIVTTMSPAAVLLILGLPIIDILAVLAQRIYQGMNWFKATRNHIHHRLLDLNFDHYETVVIIYLIQAVMVMTGLLLRHESDYLLTFIYLFYSVVIFALLLSAKYTGWQAHQGRRSYKIASLIVRLKDNSILSNGLSGSMLALLVIYLVTSLFNLRLIPVDFSLTAMVLLALMLFDWLVMRQVNLLTRLLVATTSVFVVYLEHLQAGNPIIGNFIDIYFVLLAVLLVIYLRLKIDRTLKTTPMDYLLAFGVLIMAVFGNQIEQGHTFAYLIVKGIIVLYVGESLLNNCSRSMNIISVACAISLVLMSAARFVDVSLLS